MGLFDDIVDANSNDVLNQKKGIERTESVLAYGTYGSNDDHSSRLACDEDDIFKLGPEFDDLNKSHVPLENTSPAKIKDLSPGKSKDLSRPPSILTNIEDKISDKLISTAKQNECKSISYLSKNGDEKRLKKRPFYQNQEDFLQSLNDLTKDEFSSALTPTKNAYSSYTKSENKYGMDVENLLEQIKTEENAKIPLDNVAADKQKEINTELWVDKYKPTNFLNIVGHEETKMNIMRWLKMWSLATGGSYNQFCEQNTHDPYRRPEKKVLLIEGKTGIGKNLLIEILAASCGYSLVEINGSDHIKGNVKQWLSNIVHINKSVVGKGVVNCLLIDEVSNDINDINYNLVDILKEDQKVTRDCIRHSMENKKKNGFDKQLKRLTSKLLKKPIICLTDNISSRKLASLKPFCEIIKLKQPALEDISLHLQNLLSDDLGISSDEINTANLNRFIEICNGDIRNCLNNLQFEIINDSMNLIKTEENGKLKFSIAQSHSKGKDKSKSWLNVVFDLFEPSNSQKPLETFTQNLIAQLEMVELSFSNMLQLAFDNYLVVIPNFEAASLVKYENSLNSIHDGLFFWDLMNNSVDINSKLTGYSIVSLLQFANFNYSMYQGSNSSHKQLNRKLIKVNAWYPKFIQLKKEITELVYFFKRPHEVRQTGLDTYIYNSHNAKQLVQEFLPTLSSLVNKDFMNVIRNADKRDKILMELWGILKAKDITFIRKKGSSSYADEIYLSPNMSIINIFNNFESISTNNQNMKFGETNTFLKNKQLEKVKRYPLYEALGLPVDSGNVPNNVFSKYMFMHKKFDEFTFNSVQQARSKKRKLAELQTETTSKLEEPPKKLIKTSLPKEKMTTSFDFLMKTSSNMNTKSSTEGDEDGRIWIKYKEGFSNAVKKKVTWDSFFS